MRKNVQLWYNGPGLTIEASRKHGTATFHGGGDIRYAIVDRFSRGGVTDPVFPVLAIGQGDNDDDAICAAVTALMERQERVGSDRFTVPADFSEGEWADDPDLFETWDGSLAMIDTAQDVAFVRL